MSERGPTCREVVELITAYLEDDLGADERGRVDEHLARCEGCTTYLEQMRTTIRVTGMLTQEQLPEDQKAALLAAFRDWRG